MLKSTCSDQFIHSVIPHLGLPNENVFHNHPYFKITPQKTVFSMAAGRDPQTTWIASAGLVLVPLWQHFLLNFPFTHSFLHCHCAILICIFEIIFTREVTSTRTPQHAHMIGRILRRIPPMSCLSTFILLVSPIYISRKHSSSTCGEISKLRLILLGESVHSCGENQ